MADYGTPTIGSPVETELTEREKELAQVYGMGFPDLADLDTGDPKSRKEYGEKLRLWIDAQVTDQESVIRDKRLHWMRHRLFRKGRQWISTRDGRKWREVGADDNRLRVTGNFVGPALNFRLGILEEQRPGWKHEPMPGGGPDGRERAEGQQALVEHIFKTQKIWQLIKKVGFLNQTDGTSFLQVYLGDPDASQESASKTVVPEGDERYQGLVAQGHKKVKGGVRLEAEPGPAIKTAVVPAHQTWWDPEAQTPNGPDSPALWCFLRRPMAVETARLASGEMAMEGDARCPGDEDVDWNLDTQYERGLPPYPNRKTVGRQRQYCWEHVVYLRANKVLGGKGKWYRLIGDCLVEQGTLAGGLIPLARFTDGTPDDDIFVRPEMSDWIGDQMLLNSTLSIAAEYGRSHSGSRLLAMKDTQISETWNSIVGSIIEFNGPKPDVLSALRANPDLWQLLQFALRSLENKTGWDDLGRGKIAGDSVKGFQDVSGRAVLAAIQQYERRFGPSIRAAAEGATEWAQLVVAHAQVAYTQAQMIPMTGRGDLARAIDKDNIAGPCVVYLDPDTLVPLPRTLRNQMLVDLLDKNMISKAEYKKRAPFAEIRDVHMGDTDHWERAQWINTVLEQNWKTLHKKSAEELYSVESGVLVLWQDDVNVHMEALQQLALDERKPWELRKMALDRWGVYSDLQRTKVWVPETMLPQPPAPVEVVGVPLSVPRMEERPEPTVVAGGPMGEVPGASAQPGASPSPLDAPLATSRGSAQRPMPLGDRAGEPMMGR